MKQEQNPTDVIELGCASTDTKGGHIIAEDSEGGMQPHIGLADD